MQMVQSEPVSRGTGPVTIMKAMMSDMYNYTYLHRSMQTSPKSISIARHFVVYLKIKYEVLGTVYYKPKSHAIQKRRTK